MQPQGPSIGPLGTPAGDGDPNVADEEVTFLRGRGWEPRGQCRTSYLYFSHWIAVGYPMNKHFQWQSHGRKDGSVF